MNDVIALVWQHGLPEEDRIALENFQSRDGFQVISDKDLKGMLQFFEQYPEDFEEVLPIMTDENSNYMCVYFKGEHFGKVCYLSHDELDLSPLFTNIAYFLSVISRHPEAWDFPEIPIEEYNA